MFRGKKQDDRGAAPKAEPTGHMDEWEALAVDYLDGQLDPQTKAAVERHLAGCPACAARMQSQQGALAFLRAIPLEASPAGLEDAVLDEVLFPTAPARTVVGQEADDTSGWSTLWRRKIKPWVPATVAVAAVFIALVSYGVYQSTASRSADSEATTTAVASVEPGPEAGDGNARGEENLAAGDAHPPNDVAAGQSLGATYTTAAAETTAAPATTTAAAVTTTTAGATTTAAGGMTTEVDTMGATATGNTAVTPDSIEITQDRKVMIADLEDAQEPVCFLLESAAVEEGAAKAVAADAAAGQLKELTGLEPLDESLSPDGPLFAAYVPRDDATQLVDLLRSIGASLGLSVGLSTQPPTLMSDLITRLRAATARLPELAASKAPQPAVSGWAFTTSTLAAPGGSAGAQDSQSLAGAATHILVVIWVRD